MSTMRAAEMSIYRYVRTSACMLPDYQADLAFGRPLADRRDPQLSTELYRELLAGRARGAGLEAGSA